MATTIPEWPLDRSVKLQVKMDQRLRVESGAFKFTDLERCQVRALFAAIDAGRTASLRHFAAHGTLPPADPKWGDLRVEGVAQTRQPDGSYANRWNVYAQEGGLIAEVSYAYSEDSCVSKQLCWCVRLNLPHVPPLHYGPTPQDAVDAALGALRENLGLSGPAEVAP